MSFDRNRLKLLAAQLLADDLLAVGIHTVYMKAVLGQVDAHYFHFSIFGMFLHGSLRFIWLTGIASLAR